MLLYMFVIFIEKPIRQYSKVNGRTAETIIYRLFSQGKEDILLRIKGKATDNFLESIDWYIINFLISKLCYPNGTLETPSKTNKTKTPPVRLLRILSHHKTFFKEDKTSDGLQPTESSPAHMLCLPLMRKVPWELWGRAKTSVCLKATLSLKLGNALAFS